MRAIGWLGLAGIGVAGLLACAEPEAPAAQEEPAGPVEYLSQAEVLRGLDALYLNPGFAKVSADGIAMPADLRERVERRLQDAGLRLLTAADLDRDPSLAEMQIYPSASGDDGVAGREAQAGCCTANVWISVLEGTALDRDPALHQRLPVWGEGSHTSCRSEPANAADLVLEVVDEFVADLRKANAEAEPLADGAAPTPAGARAS